MSNLIALERFGSTPWGAFGTLRMPSGGMFKTAEQPWQYNAARKSCIPAGDYPLVMRRSPMVERTSGGEFKRGWEVTGVPGRSLIMLHPGNYADVDTDGDGDVDKKGDTEGCILVGRAHAIIGGRPGVAASRAAFRDLMARLAKRDDWILRIRWITPE